MHRWHQTPDTSSISGIWSQPAVQDLSLYCRIISDFKREDDDRTISNRQLFVCRSLLCVNLNTDMNSVVKLGWRYFSLALTRCDGCHWHEALFMCKTGYNLIMLTDRHCWDFHSLWQNFCEIQSNEWLVSYITSYENTFDTFSLINSSSLTSKNVIVLTLHLNLHQTLSWCNMPSIS